MAKKLYYRLYWSTKQPVPEDVMMNRYNVVRNGAGTKGSVIGTLGTDTIIKIDKAEEDDGWTRIISVVGHDPVPVNWQEILEEKGSPVQDWEWWIDNSAFGPVTQPGGDLVLEVTIHPDLTFEVKKK